MNVNPILQQAADVLGVPVYPTVDLAKGENNYIVYEYLGETPEVYGDDVDCYDRTEIRMHWFFLEKVTMAKRKLRSFLRSHGFTITDTAEMYETDTHFRHIAVDAEYLGYVEDYEETEG